MILVVYGTTGELIKLMPVLSRLRDGGYGFFQASTGQQVQQIPPLLELAGLPPVDVWLGRGSGGRDLRSNRDIPGWGAGIAATFARRRRDLRRRLTSGDGRPLVLVHGDTMTTLFGAVIGRLLGCRVAHIESGLRSFDLLHPFPEELNRRTTSRLANILYAPGPWAASNLAHGTVVDTGSNTIRDALEMADRTAALPFDLPAEPFGIASLHRYELLRDRRLMADAIAALAASPSTVLWVDHPVTDAALQQHRLHLPEGVLKIPRLDFFSFVAIMRRSAFIVTDSGGSQEESYYLDVPCLVHRKRTERREGLGENVVLSGYDGRALRKFLEEPGLHRRTSELSASHPSDVIVADLVARGVAA